ncbi:hypothetical protein [Paenibacillus amylolyticus]|uniref:hypothetical protein n=1 Tax=Paenibacillus amylolyticus TaxID=1451 RepID=UPI003D98461D
MKLIDADKLLEWLAEKSSHLGSDERLNAFEEVQDNIGSGEFNPDIKPGDKVNVVDEIQFPFLKNVKVDNIQWHRGGWYAKLRFTDELYTIPLSRCRKVRESIPKEDTKDGS